MVREGNKGLRVGKKLKEGLREERKGPRKIGI